MDMYDYLTSVFTIHPELMDWCDTLFDAYRHKNWDDLGLYLETFIYLPIMQEGDALIQLYHNFIVHFATELNLLTLAQFAVKVCHQYQQKESAINYLESVIEKLQPMAIVTEGIEEPILLLNMEKAFFLLKNGDKKECKNLLDNGKSILDRMFDYNMDDCVYANYYRVSYEYLNDCNEYADCYKTGLLYLAYELLESIMATSKRDLACNLSICALLGDNVYNFQGLLEHPIIHSLVGSESECLYHILVAMNSRNVVHCKELCHLHKAFLDTHPALVKNKKKLLEKINIICLIEIISGGHQNRITPLTVIAESTMLTVEYVERLLMKSLSVHVIEGMIDQVDGTVNVTWVQPRVLGIPDVEILRDRLDSWLGKIERAIISWNPDEELVAAEDEDRSG